MILYFNRLHSFTAFIRWYEGFTNTYILGAYAYKLYCELANYRIPPYHSDIDLLIHTDYSHDYVYKAPHISVVHRRINRDRLPYNKHIFELLD